MYGEQEESIYNLIPREHQAECKAARHHSKFKHSVKHEQGQNRAEYRTMGPAKVATRPPDDYLKRHEKEPQLPQKSGFKYTDQERRKPNVPKQEDRPLMGVKTNKNFITQNAVSNIMSVPKKAEKIYVDTRKGDKQQLIPSGLEPKYIHRDDFGEVPLYLTKRKDEMQQAQEEYDTYIAESFKRGCMQMLTQEIREEILNGLKYNWEELHHQYQGLSVVTDTVPKKNRKERMEAEMKQLERDIELIEKHSVIYIAN